MSILDGKEQLQNQIQELKTRYEQIRVAHAELNIEHTKLKANTDLVIKKVLSTEDRNKAEKTLSESENHYKALFNLNPLPMWIYDFETTDFIDVNEAAIRHYGYSREEFLCMSIRDIRPPDEIQRLKNHSKILLTSPTHHGYWRHIKKDGAVIHVEVTAQLIDYSGRKATLVLCNDITQKIKVESKLIRSNRRLQVAQQIAGMGYWELNLFTEELYWSDQAYAILGVEKTASPPDFETFFNVVHPDDREYVLEKKRVVENGNPNISAEHRIILKDGTIKIICEKASLIYNEAGIPVTLEGIVQDITVRKQAEEALRVSNERYVYATKATFDAIWDWDIDSDYLYWGEGYEKIFGYKIPDKIENHIDSFDNIHPDDRPAVFDGIHKLLSGSELNWTSEYRYRKANGDYAHVQDKGIIIRDDTGKAIRMIGAMQDITEQKMAERAIRQTQEKFTSLVNTIDGIVWEADAQTFAFTYVSRRAETLLGYPAERWINEPGFWASHIYAEDRDDAIKYCVDQTRLKREHQFEYRMIAADGRIVWLCDFVSVVVEKDEPVQLRGVMVDITERKKTEEAIKVSEEKYRFLFERNLSGIYQTTPKGVILTCNEAFANMLGYASPKDLLRKNASMLYFAKTDRNTFVNHLREKGEINNQEIKLKHRDGGPVFLIENCLLLKDNKTGEEIIQGALINITERKNAEEALVKERKLLRTLIDNLPDYIYVKDKDARLIINNKANLADLGFESEEEVAGKTIVDILGEEFGGEYLKDDRKVLQSGEPIINQEKLVFKKNGESHWLLTTKIPIKDEDNQVIGLVGINRNITERKQAEEALIKERKLLRVLIDNLPDYIYVKDIACRHIINNKANIELLGFRSEEETIHKTIVELLGSQIAGDFMKDDQKVLRSARPIIDREEPIFNKNGEKRWLLTTKIPFKDENNQVIGLVGISRDITERKEKDEELTEKNSQLKSLSKHLQNVREEERKFLAREVHDELGQLVSAVKMDIDWLGIRLPDLEEVPKKRLLHASSTADILIHTIRKIASTLRPSMLDDFGLNTALAWQCQEFTSANGIPCEFEQVFDDSELSFEIKTELFRICQESLTNVMRHAVATRVKVSINDTREGVYLCIADNGKGFDSKQKADTLGLIGMRERALSVNGTLTLKTEPGKGTSISAIIPKNKNSL